MARAYVRFRHGDLEHELVPGDIVGRSWTCALAIDDGRISEAHALVSLRGGDLQLLALRGRFAVDGKPLSELSLAPGQRVELARGLSVEVLEVGVPSHVLALEGDVLARRPLAGVCSLVMADEPKLVAGYDPRAAARIWNRGGAWSVQIGSDVAQPLRAGDSIEVSGHAFRAVEIAVASAGPTATVAEGALSPELRIVTQYDSVQLQAGDRTVHLGGISARIICELGAMGGPASWEAVAREIWPRDDDRLSLRRRWDVALTRMRRKLRESRIRSDLVVSNGTGCFELFLQPGDVVEDRS